MSAAMAQPAIGAAFDSTHVETGEPFKLRIAIIGAADKPSLPDFTGWDSILPVQNILKQTGWQRNGEQWTDTATLIAFDSAFLRLPPLPVRLADGRVLLTESLSIMVVPTPVNADMATLADIKDIHREPIKWTDFMPWIIGAVLLTLFLCLAYWLLNRKPVPQPAPKPLVEQPPHQWAMQELEQLEQKQYWQQGEIKTYYADLTFILRGYLERRYRIPALESTSDETLRHLRQTDFPGEQTYELQILLLGADSVKFAKGIPEAEYHEEALRKVRHLVQTTAISPLQRPSATHV
jgi:hypothetical protein